MATYTKRSYLKDRMSAQAQAEARQHKEQMIEMMPLENLRAARQLTQTSLARSTPSTRHLVAGHDAVVAAIGIS